MRHRVEFDLSSSVETITARILCAGPRDSQCRAYPVGSCGCESWNVEVDEDGPYHEAAEFPDDDDAEVTIEVTVRHRMAYGEDCNIIDWAQSVGVIECYDGSDTAPVNGPIVVWFDDDCMCWRYEGDPA